MQKDMNQMMIRMMRRTQLQPKQKKRNRLKLKNNLSRLNNKKIHLMITRRSEEHTSELQSRIPTRRSSDLGTVEKIHVEEGTVDVVGDPLVTFDAEGYESDDDSDDEEDSTPTETKEEEPSKTEEQPEQAEQQEDTSDDNQ